MIFKLACCLCDTSEFISSPHNIQNVKHYWLNSQFVTILACQEFPQDLMGIQQFSSDFFKVVYAFFLGVSRLLFD